MAAMSGPLSFWVSHASWIVKVFGGAPSTKRWTELALSQPPARPTENTFFTGQLQEKEHCGRL